MRVHYWRGATTACGLVGVFSVTGIPGRVDCRNCRRTREHDEASRHERAREIVDNIFREAKS